jgi:hypothetical protein
LILAATLGIGQNAHADMGVPMIAVFLPPMWLSLIPVVILEAWILRRVLEIPSRAALVSSAVGNITTTIVGIPLVWTVLAVAQLLCCGGAMGLGTVWHRVYAVTIQAPWLIPYREALGWMIPAALAVLVVPFFLLTVAIEGYVNRRLLRNVDGGRVWRATWRANAWSYLLIFALAWPAFFVANHLRGLFGPLTSWIMEAVFKITKLLSG